MTTVINVHNQDARVLYNEPDFVYVGRGMPTSGWRWSTWANPFKLSEYNFDRKRVVTLYAIDTAIKAEKGKPDRKEFDRLKGKRLGCWCRDWQPGQPHAWECHAIVLALIAEGNDPWDIVKGLTGFDLRGGG